MRWMRPSPCTIKAPVNAVTAVTLCDHPVEQLERWAHSRASRMAALDPGRQAGWVSDCWLTHGDEPSPGGLGTGERQSGLQWRG